MKRHCTLFASKARGKHWGPIRGKQDMRRIEEKRVVKPPELLQEKKSKPWPKDGGSLGHPQVVPSTLEAPRKENEVTPEREKMLKLMAERRRQQASDDFRCSVVNLLQQYNPPLYPDSMRFFEDLPADVLTPVPPPAAPKDRTVPHGYVPFLERQLLELFSLAFRSKATMVQAFTHPSFFGGDMDSKFAKRCSLLSFTYVGHAILHFHMRSYIMQVWPNRSLDEYQLFVSHWLDVETVCGLAESLQLPQLTLTDAAHAHEDSFLTQQGIAGYAVHKPSVRIGCEVFESLVGAIYMDSDIAKATDFIQTHAVSYFTRHIPKSVFESVREHWEENATLKPPSNKGPKGPKT